MSIPPHLKLDIHASRAAIASIRQFDLEEVSIDEIKDALTPVFRGYVVSAPRFAPALEIFRARLMAKPQNVHELLYPPVGVGPLGRVNREGNPLLYCATARSATFFELAPQIGDTVAIAKWAITSPLLVNHVGYTPSVFYALGSGRSHASWGDRPVENPGDDDNGEIAAFLAGAFTKRVPPSERCLYKLSVAISEKLFADELFDGLVYPTIAMQANADNLAIKPRFADSKLKFVRAEFARIDAVHDLKLDITVLDTAVAVGADGTIGWRGRVDHWVLRNQGDAVRMSVENGRWVARDQNGNIVEPE